MHAHACVFLLIFSIRTNTYNVYTCGPVASISACPSAGARPTVSGQQRADDRSRRRCRCEARRGGQGRVTMAGLGWCCVPWSGLVRSSTGPARVHAWRDLSQWGRARTRACVPVCAAHMHVRTSTVSSSSSVPIKWWKYARIVQYEWTAISLFVAVPFPYESMCVKIR
jgi:hypothetical protein